MTPFHTELADVATNYAAQYFRQHIPTVDTGLSEFVKNFDAFEAFLRYVS